MVLDTSALLAMLLGEPQAAAIAQAIVKGRHPAGLNLGDCCSYALARQRGEPLLFKGNDFAQTDIDVVAY